MGGRRLRRRARPFEKLLVVFGIGFAACLAAAPARAFDLPALLMPDLAAVDWMGGADTFAGVDVTDSALFSYGGFTLAPGGRDHDGWRFRLYAGVGHYTYRSSVESVAGLIEFDRRADVLQAEALVGWQASVGAMTAKLFAGVAYEEQVIAPADPENPIAGEHVGAKAAVETWFDLAPWAWLSADASYATTLDAYSGAVKLGLNPHAAISFGPEGSVFGNREFDAHRLGAFARWHCGGCDVTISGGVAGNYDEETGGYGALAFYRRF
ncbi:cellulose biosynthesis protein BcsS [Dichotomicrobium thermohalophilum]|nr:cellulose biosynthesis protein BcsS [Dichotomicrobium thermohalophilum]